MIDLDQHFGAVSDQWRAILAAALADHKRRCPSDQRSDREILTSLMEHFAATGIVKKSGGKFLIPKIVP